MLLGRVIKANGELHIAFQDKVNAKRVNGPMTNSESMLWCKNNDIGATKFVWNVSDALPSSSNSISTQDIQSSGKDVSNHL